MTEPQTSSKEKLKTENESFDRKGLSVGETTSTSGMSSCYEINVHENFSSDSNTSKGSNFFYARPKLMVKVKKVGGNKEENETNQNTHLFVENLKRIANPLIESYYPFLEENQIGNVTIEINLNLNSEGKENEQKNEQSTCQSIDEKSVDNTEDSSSKKSFESASNDNQETKEEKKLAVNSFSKLRKKLKRQILQDMLTKKDGEFKDVQWKDVDEPLHFHHHEHHHHYYVDASKMKDDSEFSLLQSVSNTPAHWPGNKEHSCKTTNTLNSDVDVKEKERSSYLYDCSRQHPVNFLLDNTCNLSNLTFVRKSKEEYMKIADKCTYRTTTINPMKKASSLDSLGQKKSDFIVFPNYSNTEISKCDSEESSITDASSFVTNVKKNMTIEHKRSKLPGGESEVVAGKEIQGNDPSGSALVKSSDEKCRERRRTFKDKLNKKLINRSENKLKALEEKNEDSKGEFEILVEDEEEKSEPIHTTSSESEPVDGKTDKETSDEITISTASSHNTSATSAKDTVTVAETSEDGSNICDEKCIVSKTSKPAVTSEDKMKSSSCKKTDSNGQAGVKSKPFGTAGNNKNKDKLLSTAKKSGHYVDSRKDSLRFWSHKLRQELKKIKSELQSLEEDHINELAQKRFAKKRASRPHEYTDNGISVYSAKTYIVEPNNFKVVNDLREREYPVLFKNKSMFSKQQTTYLYSSPKRREWGDIHTENKVSTKEKGFYWNQHFVSMGRKVFS